MAALATSVTYQRLATREAFRRKDH